jgi:uncharacterized repeat protein (TIGR01451 family)/LPXTG-motif cell wall-anchored protein
MKISRLFNSLPKRLFASFLVFLAVMLPVATSAASTVKMEGSMGVANVSKGDKSYAASVNATYDQIVELQVYYHNTEMPDSGKNAQNVRVKIDIPSTPGKVQKQTATISADNSNTVTAGTTVNLDDANEYLQYIPGTAVWRHNTGTNDNVKETDTKISDSVVTGANGVIVEQSEKPCYNFAATITVQARVVMPSTKVVKQVEKANETGKWATSNTANPGDTLKYMITYTNTGNTTANNVIIRDNLPPHMTYVPNTTYVYNGSNPSGALDKSNAVTTDGIIIGNYAPGVTAYVTLEVKVDSADQLACGDTTFTNVGIAHPKGTPEFYNTAITKVTKQCQTEQPQFSCNLLTLTKGDNRTVTASVTYTAKNGAAYKSTSFNWGDGKTTSGAATSASHSYAKDGTYPIVATVSFTVNGVTKTDTGNCKGSVTFKTPPTKTPVFSCDLLNLSQGDNRSVTASVNYTAQNGAKFKTATFDWGDGSTPLTTSKTTASYTYAKDGTYTVTAKLLFSVNGTDKFAPANEACVKQVTFTTTPTPPVTPPSELPNTGAGNVISLVAGVAAISAIGYRLFLGRKLARR